MFQTAAGIFDISTAPQLDDPAAPTTKEVLGLARRATGYPAAPELTAVPVERLIPIKTSSIRPTDIYSDDQALPDPSDPEAITPETAAADVDASLPDAEAQGEAAEQLPGRRLQQAERVPLRRRATGVRGGFSGAEPSATAAVHAGGGASIAVSDDRAVHITSGVVAIYSLLPGSGEKNATLGMIRTQDLFAPVGSSNCKDGLYDSHAVFDAHAKRFYIAVACGGTGA